MIIGISGKIGSGKDTVGKIIKQLDDITYPAISTITKHNWQIVKFADALKDIICILTGCTREQLEDTDFKNSKLPAEWSNYIYYRFIDSHLSVKYISTTQKDKDYIFKEYTYRDLLQILGTDLLRNQLHENVWVNALFSKYKPKICSGSTHCALASKPEISCNLCPEYPNWIITDVRFPNEAKAVKDKGGIIIRVNRGIYPNDSINNQSHISETALDNYEFDYIIDNNDTIEELIEKVKEVLIKLKIIKL